jgi:hypothetical protein
VEMPADTTATKGVNTSRNRCPIAIVGIGGSLGQGSASLAALDIALATAAQAGAEVKRFAVG